MSIINKEYDNSTKSGLTANAWVEIKSTQSDLTGSLLFEDIISSAFEDEDGNFDISPIEGGDAGDYLMRGECFFSCENDKITLKYAENDPDMDGVVTSISFLKDNCGLVIIEREGVLSHSFVIEEGVRNYSVYTTPVGPLDICVYGRLVKNELTEEGGSLMLDYAVELKGMTAQRTKMHIKLKK